MRFFFVRFLYPWNLCDIILHSRSFLIRTASLDMPFPMSFVKGGICSYELSLFNGWNKDFPSY